MRNPFRKNTAIKTYEQKSFSIYQLMPKLGVTAKWTDFSTLQAIRKAYKRSTWVYACMRVRADNFASVPWVVERKTPDGWAIDENNPYHDLINKPSRDFDWQTMMRLSIQLRDLSGDFYMSKERANGETGKVKNIYPLMPDKMEVIQGLFRLVDRYKYYKGSVRAEMPAEDVVHLKYTSPEDLIFGMPPLQSIARAIDIDEEAENWQKKMLQNMLMPSGVFSFKDSTVQEIEQYQAWLTKHLDEGDRGRPLILGNGEWKETAFNANEIAFIQSRKLIREEICSGFGVQPVMIGILDNATLANIETAKKILWDETLIPKFEETKGQLNRQFIEDDRYRVRPDFSNVPALQDDYSEKIKTAKEMWSMGISLEQINQRLELGLDTELIEGADIGYLPAGLLPTNFNPDDFIQGGRSASDTAYGTEGEE